MIDQPPYQFHHSFDYFIAVKSELMDIEKAYLSGDITLQDAQMKINIIRLKCYESFFHSTVHPFGWKVSEDVQKALTNYIDAAEDALKYIKTNYIDAAEDALKYIKGEQQ